MFSMTSYCIQTTNPQDFNNYSMISPFCFVITDKV